MSALLDLLLDLIDMLSMPRVLASLVLAAAVAIFLANHVPWFSGGMGLSMVVLSAGVGLVWEARSELAAQRRAAQGRRAPRVFLALLLCAAGLAWMATAGPLVGSFDGRLAVLAAAPLAIGGLYALVFWRPLPIRPVLFAAFWLCSGVLVVWWLAVGQGLM